MPSDAFSDAHPFDWVDGYSADEIRDTLSPLLRQTVDALAPGDVVLDVGCGAGRLLTYLASREIRGLGVDISRVSLRLMRDRSGSPGVQADNTRLPFPDAVADLVVSDGVLHHVGDSRAGFAEDCRLVAPAGRLYLAVYRPGSRYEWTLRVLGPGVRALLRHPAGRALVHATLLPAYWSVHLLRSGGRRSWRAARNLFYDYFARPVIKFVSREQIESWAAESGMRVAQYDPDLRRNLHRFVLCREAAARGGAADGDPSGPADAAGPLYEIGGFE